MSMTIKCRSGMEIRHRSVWDCNITRTLLKHEKVGKQNLAGVSAAF